MNRDDLTIHKQCANCLKPFIVYDKGLWLDTVRVPFWFKEVKDYCCSDKCLAKLEDDFAYEYEKETHTT